jgi:group I intron endonuclease
MQSGIYYLTFIGSSKLYIGSSYQIQRRIIEHRTSLRSSRHRNKKILYSFQKYGEASMVTGILEICDPQHLLMKEQAWINYLDPQLNILPVAGSTRGSTRTIKSRQKQSATIRERGPFKHTKESISQIKASLRAFYDSDAGRVWRAALSKIKSSQRFSPQTIEKMRLAAKNRVHSIETRRKMSSSQTGHIVSEETRRKISLANKAKWAVRLGK